VMLNAKNGQTDWNLVRDRKTVEVRVSGRISSHDDNSVRIFVCEGHGVGFLPATYCNAAIASGRLVRLLPQWTSAPIPICAIYPSRRFVPITLSVFLEALAGWKNPDWTAA
jgi:DNA-binding transcriptional LysR family regulator